MPKRYIKYSLLYKLSIFTLTTFSLMVLFTFKGWLQDIFLTDTTHITEIIAFILFVGIFLSFVKAFHISKETDNVQNSRFTPVDPRGLDILLLDKSSYLSSISFMANASLLFGIAGTVIGLKIALSKVTPAAIQDISLAAGMFTELLRGVSIKLSTTLVGIISSLWLRTNHHLLAKDSQDNIVRMIKK